MSKLEERLFITGPGSTFILWHNIAYAMKGMHGSGDVTQQQHRMQQKAWGIHSIHPAQNSKSPTTRMARQPFLFNPRTSIESPGNMLSGDLNEFQKIDNACQSTKNWNDVPELSYINTPIGEEHCPIIAPDNLTYFSHNQPGVTQNSDI